MNLLDYIDPVELDKPEEYHIASDELLSRKITIHTPSFNTDDLSRFQLAILGAPEDRNSFNKGASLAPDRIRSELYKLVSPVSKTSIIDLGNLKAGNTFNDTYVALKEVVYRLLCDNIIVVLIGGTQELTLPAFQAFENYQEKINLTVFDSRIDSQKAALRPNADSFVFELLLKKRKLFRFVHAGHQAYLTEKHSLELLNKLFHEAIRLGEVRSDLKKIEPVLRDTDLVSFDMGCIRQSDSPGHFRPSPNGFYAEEACQLARYSGGGDQVRLFGVFESNPRFDQHEQSAALAAQLIWHFIEGVEHRCPETPNSEDNDFKTFIVGHSDLDYDMVFYKSQKTERWWLEIPNLKGEAPLVVSCSHDDYVAASNHEVPNLWWKYFQKLG